MLPATRLSNPRQSSLARLAPRPASLGAPGRSMEQDGTELSAAGEASRRKRVRAQMSCADCRRYASSVAYGR